jgi:asparagine synthase (glutamine-hydrolysing)
MCGIWASILANLSPELIRELSAKLQNRGSDGTYSQQISGDIHLVFHHLALQGATAYTHQPLMKDGVYLICNGHIYNHLSLYDNITGILPRETPSDCEVILSLYCRIADSFTESLWIDEVMRQLDGVFAFVLVDTHRNRILISRDEFGVRPLYISKTTPTNPQGWIVSSLRKGIPGESIPVLPGTSLWIERGERGARLKEISWKPPLSFRNSIGTGTDAIVAMFAKAIHERLQVKTHIGCLLSGGVMSTLMCKCIVDWFLENRGGRRGTLSPKRITKDVHTFTIGIGENHPDIISARKVAEILGTTHHELILKPDYDSLESSELQHRVIIDLETDSPELLKQGKPMWLLGQFIANVSQEMRKSKKGTIKKLFIGEGIDILSHPERIHTAFESEYLVFDRCFARWGLDVEFPWLDKDVVNVVLETIKQQGVSASISRLFESMLQEVDELPEEIRNRKYVPLELLF